MSLMCVYIYTAVAAIIGVGNTELWHVEGTEFAIISEGLWC